MKQRLLLSLLFTTNCATYQHVVGGQDGDCAGLPERHSDLAPPDSDAECERLLSAVKAKFPQVDFKGVWVEWSGPIIIPNYPEPVAGTIKGELPWPWLEWTVLVISSVNKKGEPWTARQSALNHEMILHFVPQNLGRGPNADHSDPELKAFHEALLKEPSKSSSAAPRMAHTATATTTVSVPCHEDLWGP